jgi:hypothetical protein
MLGLLGIYYAIKATELQKYVRVRYTKLKDRRVHWLSTSLRYCQSGR